MKRLLLSLSLICLTVITLSQNVAHISAAEFFVDNDPGTGNGTLINTGSVATVVNFTANVPTTSLAPGFHNVSIRTKDADGKWGIFESRGFYISSATTNVSEITAAEFFIDTDPGVGNATSINVGTAGASVSFIVNTSAATLAPGFHNIFIRTKDAGGNWGLFESRGFYISNASSNVANITAAEYFIDADPGVGNGIAMNITTPGSTVNLIGNVPTTSLPQGFHNLFIRTKDAAGNWGLFESRGFYISNTMADVTEITTAEYFIDTDPGVGNGAALTITTPGRTINQAFNITIPQGISTGDHYLFIRVKTASNTWGLFQKDTFTVSDVLPLTLLNFEGKKNAGQVSLQWKTMNEMNTSHFLVQKSTDGINFYNIGNVNSTGNSFQNTYSFTDITPAKGINFYRLQQVDRDGKYSYSPIIQILFSFKTDLVIYPNPVKDKLNVSLPVTGDNWIAALYAADGRVVKITSVQASSAIQIPVDYLPKGHYVLKLTNGTLQHTASFIKD